MEESKKYVVFYYLKEDDRWIYDILTEKELQSVNLKHVGKIWELGKEKSIVLKVI